MAERPPSMEAGEEVLRIGGEVTRELVLRDAPLAMTFRCPDMLGQSIVVYSSNVDWPLMEIQSPVHFNDGVDYGRRRQEAAVDEVDGAVNGEEGEV